MFARCQMLDNAQASGRDNKHSLLPDLKRRNSGRRNLGRPWTSTEEDQLVRLIDQADYRKQVQLVQSAWH